MRLGEGLVVSGEWTLNITGLPVQEATAYSVQICKQSYDPAGAYNCAQEALALGVQYGVEIIPGIEISAYDYK